MLQTCGFGFACCWQLPNGSALGSGKFSATCCVLAMMKVRTLGGSGTSTRPRGSVTPSDCRPSQTSKAVATWKILGQVVEAEQRSRTPCVRPVIGSDCVAYEKGKS